MGEVETKRPHGGSTERQSEGKMGKFSGYSNTCFYSNRLPSLRLSLSVLCGRFTYDGESTVSPCLSVAGHRSWYTLYLLRETRGNRTVFLIRMRSPNQVYGISSVIAFTPKLDPLDPHPCSNYVDRKVVAGILLISNVFFSKT